MNNILSGIIGGTVTLVAIYLFIANADESSRVIESLSGAYIGAVTALQGQNGPGLKVRRLA